MKKTGKTNTTIQKDGHIDKSYWEKPLPYRIYCRILYAFLAFIIVGSFFDVFTTAPMWMQVALGLSVALAVLLFRIAYPNGAATFYAWILEGMYEASKDMENKGITPQISSKTIAEKLKQYTSDSNMKTTSVQENKRNKK